MGHPYRICADDQRARDSAAYVAIVGPGTVILEGEAMPYYMAVERLADLFSKRAEPIYALILDRPAANAAEVQILADRTKLYGEDHELVDLPEPVIGFVCRQERP